MKVVVTCQPARGHFHPLLPLLRALQDQGHELSVATSASFAAVVERAGVPAVAVGVDWLESAVDTAFPDLIGDATELASIQQGWLRVFSAAARRFLPDLVAVLRRARPDLVISEGFEYTGSLAAEVIGLPHAQFGVGPLLPLPVLADAVGPYWAGARASLGLPPDPTLSRLSPDLYLAAYPASFQPLPLARLSRVAVTVRPEALDVDGEVVVRDGTQPLVYVTMGTVFNRVSGIFETVLAALADQPVHVVAAIGEARNAAMLGPVPGNIRVIPFVRQAELLQQADVVVFHGGSATTVAAIAHGVPSLAIPLGADQAYNGLRLSAAGAGRTLELAELTVDRVRRDVRELLGNPRYRDNAARLRTELESAPTMGQVVPLLERLVAIARAGSRSPGNATRVP